MSSLYSVLDLILHSFRRAKYPLAMVKKITDILGERILIGYDIGCSFQSTVARSRLQSSFSASKSRFCVPSFHGFAHKYDCQLHFHPMFISGAGIEDFEGTERVWNSSNNCARITRHATPFRRRRVLHHHFQTWNDDKYENLATFIHDNYHQAARIISEEGEALAEALTEWGYTEEDLKRWSVDESLYFENVGQ
jgi:hypothetical protein